ncbi:PRD domain-containing protein [Bacillus sp. T33-2]|uniref:PRD domain-containing protein n=1 Tax=Bacillus sp. T33-2 TaxID=2054168 RepID=UPI000C76A0DA|nr:PRD domain-containing protein [Bacillus sp. T33-2]PLR94448.1 hypothetical protein CVD19_17320 [Bacillus sp. T33-2]
MNRDDLNERLRVLQFSNTITAEAAQITVKAYGHLTATLSREDILQGEMLFTHLPMALSRLASGENIENPPAQVLQEALNAGYADEARNEVSYIEEQWGRALPDAEKGYLMIHYSLVFQVNTGGETG